jgi:hypothetical protein
MAKKQTIESPSPEIKTPYNANLEIISSAPNNKVSKGAVGQHARKEAPYETPTG